MQDGISNEVDPVILTLSIVAMAPFMPELQVRHGVDPCQWHCEHGLDCGACDLRPGVILLDEAGSW
jgi:hypothetical protein